MLMGATRVAFAFTFTGDRAAAIDLVADAERLEQLEPVVPAA